MKKWIFIIVGIFAVLCLMVLVFFFGGVIGYMTGMTYHTAYDAPLDGLNIAVTLRALREGRTENAISLLETTLDTKIVEYSLLKKGKYPIFDLWRMNDHMEKFMGVIAKYRMEYPTKSPGPVDSVIKELLSEYEIKE